MVDSDFTDSSEKNKVSRPPIDIKAAIAPKINLAFHQNSVPTVIELIIINESEAPLKDVELVLSSTSFFQTKSWHVDLVAPNQHYHIKDIDIQLDGTLLARLTEAETIQVSFVLLASGEKVATRDIPIELLARNQWGGIGHMP